MEPSQNRDDIDEAVNYSQLLLESGKTLSLTPSPDNELVSMSEDDPDEAVLRFYETNNSLTIDPNAPGAKQTWEALSRAYSKNFRTFTENIEALKAQGSLIAEDTSNLASGIKEGGATGALGGTVEGLVRSVTDIIGLARHSTDPSSLVFGLNKAWRSLTTGETDWPADVEQWNKARKYQYDSELVRQGDMTVYEQILDLDDGTIRFLRSTRDPKVANFVSLIGLELNGLLRAPFTKGAARSAAIKAGASTAKQAAQEAAEAGVYSAIVGGLERSAQKFDNLAGKLTDTVGGGAIYGLGKALEVPGKLAESLVGANVRRVAEATGIAPQHIKNAAATLAADAGQEIGAIVGRRQTVGFLGSLGIQSVAELSQTIGSEMLRRGMGVIDASTPTGLTVLERVALNPNLSKSAQLGAKFLNVVVDPVLQLSTSSLKHAYRDALTLAALGYASDKERGAFGGFGTGMVWGGMSGALRHSWAITNGALTNTVHIKNFDDNYLPNFVEKTNPDFAFTARKLISDVDAFGSTKISSNIRSVIQTLWSSLDASDRRGLLSFVGNTDGLKEYLISKGVRNVNVDKYKGGKGVFTLETAADGKRVPVIFLDSNGYRSADAAHEALSHALSYSLITKGKIGEHLMRFFGHAKDGGVVSDDIHTHNAAHRRSSELAIEFLEAQRAAGKSTPEQRLPDGAVNPEYIKKVNETAKYIYEGSAGQVGSKAYYQHWLDQARALGASKVGWWLSTTQNAATNSFEPTPYSLVGRYWLGDVDANGRPAFRSDSPIRFMFEESLASQAEAMFIHTNLQDLVLPDEMKPFRMNIERMMTNRLARIVTEMELAGMRAKYSDAYDANGRPTVQLEVYDDGVYNRYPEMESFFRSFVRDAMNHDAQAIRFLSPAAQAAEARMFNKEFLFNFGRAGATMKGSKELNEMFAENAGKAIEVLEALDPSIRPEIILDAYGNKTVDMLKMNDAALDALVKSGALDGESARIAKGVKDAYAQWEKTGYASPNMFYGVYWGESHRTERNGFFKRLLGRDTPVTNRVFVPFELRLSYRTTDDAGKPLRTARGGALMTVVDYMAIHRRKMRLWQRPDVRATFVTLDAYNKAFDEYMLNMMKEPSSRKTTVELFRSQFPGNADKVRDILYETFGGSIRKDETYINRPREGYSSSHENPNYPIHSMRLEMLVGVDLLQTRPFPYHHGNSYEPLRRNLSLAGFERVGLSDNRYHNGQGYEIFAVAGGWKTYSPFGGVIGVFKTMAKAISAVNKDMKKVDSADVMPLPTESEWASMNRSERLQYMSKAGRAFHRSSFGAATDVMGHGMKSCMSVDGTRSWTPEIDETSARLVLSTVFGKLQDYKRGRIGVAEIERSFRLEDILSQSSMSDLTKWFAANKSDMQFDIRQMTVSFRGGDAPSDMAHYERAGNVFRFVGATKTIDEARGTGFGVNFDPYFLSGLSEQDRNAVLLEGIKQSVAKLSVAFSKLANSSPLSFYTLGEAVKKPAGVSMADFVAQYNRDVELLNHVRELQSGKAKAPKPEIASAIADFVNSFYAEFGGKAELESGLRALIGSTQKIRKRPKNSFLRHPTFEVLNNIIHNSFSDPVLSAKGRAAAQCIIDFGNTLSSANHSDFIILPTASRSAANDVSLHYVSRDQRLLGPLVDLITYLDGLAGKGNSASLLSDFLDMWVGRVDHAGLQIHSLDYINAADKRRGDSAKSWITARPGRMKAGGVQGIINPNVSAANISGRSAMMITNGNYEPLVLFPDTILTFSNKRLSSSVMGATEVPIGNPGLGGVTFPMTFVPADWAIKSNMLNSITVPEIQNGMHLKWLAAEMSALSGGGLDLEISKILSGKGKDALLGSRRMTKAEMLLALVVQNKEMMPLLERAQATLHLERVMDEDRSFMAYVRAHSTAEAQSLKKDADFELFRNEILIPAAQGAWYISIQNYSALGHAGSGLSAGMDSIMGRRVWADIDMSREERYRVLEMVQAARDRYKNFILKDTSLSLASIGSSDPDYMKSLAQSGLLKQYSVRGSAPKMMLEISDRDSYVDYSAVRGEPHLLPFMGAADPEKAFSDYSATIRRLAQSDSPRIYLSNSRVLGVTTLGKVFGHEDLYFHFPQMRDVRVVFKDFHGARYVPGYAGRNPVIEIGARTFTSETLEKQTGIADSYLHPSVDDLKSRVAEKNTAVGIITHEVQHALQDAADMLPDAVELKRVSDQYIAKKLIRLLGGEHKGSDGITLDAPLGIAEVIRKSELPVARSFSEGASSFLKTAVRNMTIFAENEYKLGAIDAPTFESFLRAQLQSELVHTATDAKAFWDNYTRLVDGLTRSNPRYFATFWDDSAHRAAVNAMGMISALDSLASSSEPASALIRVRKVIEKYSNLDYLTDSAEVMAYETSRRRGMGEAELADNPRKGPDGSILSLVDKAMSNTAYGRDAIRADIASDDNGLNVVFKSIGGIGAEQGDSSGLASLGKLGLMKWFARKGSNELRALNKLIISGAGWEVTEDGRLVLTKTEALVSGNVEEAYVLLEGGTHADVYDPEFWTESNLSARTLVKATPEGSKVPKSTYTLSDVIRLAGLTLDAESTLSVGNGVIDLVMSDRFPPLVDGKNIVAELHKVGTFSEDAANAVMLREIAQALPDRVFTKNDLLNLFTFAHTSVFTSVAVSGEGSGKIPKVKERPSREAMTRALRKWAEDSSSDPASTVQRFAEIGPIVEKQSRSKQLGIVRFTINRAEFAFAKPDWITLEDWTAFKKRFTESALGKRLLSFKSHLSEADIAILNDRMAALAPLIGPVYDKMVKEYVSYVNEPGRERYRAAFIDASMSEMAEQYMAMGVGSLGDRGRMAADDVIGMHAFRPQASAELNRNYDLSYVVSNERALQRLGVDLNMTNLLGYGGAARKSIRGQAVTGLGSAAYETIGDAPSALTLAFSGYATDPETQRGVVTVTTYEPPLASPQSAMPNLVETGIVDSGVKLDDSAIVGYAEKGDKKLLGDTLGITFSRENTTFTENAVAAFKQVSEHINSAIASLTEKLTHLEHAPEVADGIRLSISRLQADEALSLGLMRAYDLIVKRRNSVLPNESKRAINLVDTSPESPLYSILPGAAVLAKGADHHSISALNPNSNSISNGGIFGVKIADGRLVLGAESYFSGPNQIDNVGVSGLTQKTIPEAVVKGHDFRMALKDHAIASMLFQLRFDARRGDGFGVPTNGRGAIDVSRLSESTGAVQRLGGVSEALNSFYSVSERAKKIAADGEQTSVFLTSSSATTAGLVNLLDGSGAIDVGTFYFDAFSDASGQTIDSWIRQNAARLGVELREEFVVGVPKHLMAQSYTLGAAIAPFALRLFRSGKITEIDGLGYLDVFVGRHEKFQSLLKAAQDFVDAPQSDKAAAGIILENAAKEANDGRLVKKVDSFVDGLVNQQSLTATASSVGAMCIYEAAKTRPTHRNKPIVESANLCMCFGGEHFVKDLGINGHGLTGTEGALLVKAIKMSIASDPEGFLTGIALGLAAHRKTVVGGVRVGRQGASSSGPGNVIVSSSEGAAVSETGGAFVSYIPKYGKKVGALKEQIPTLTDHDFLTDGVIPTLAPPGEVVTFEEKKPSVSEFDLRAQLPGVAHYTENLNLIDTINDSSGMDYTPINQPDAAINVSTIIPSPLANPEVLAANSGYIPFAIGVGASQFTSSKDAAALFPYKRLSSTYSKSVRHKIMRHQAATAAKATNSTKVSIQPARYVVSPKPPTILAGATRTDAAHRMTDFVIEHALMGVYPQVAYNELVRPHPAFSWKRLDDGRVMLNFCQDVNMQGTYDFSFAREHSARRSNLGINLIRAIGWDSNSSSAFMAPAIRSGLHLAGTLGLSKSSRISTRDIGAAVRTNMRFLPRLDDPVIAKALRDSAARSLRPMAIGSSINAVRSTELRSGLARTEDALRLASEFVSGTGSAEAITPEIAYGMDAMIGDRSPGFNYVSVILPKNCTVHDINTAIASLYASYFTSSRNNPAQANMLSSDLTSFAFNTAGIQNWQVSAINAALGANNGPNQKLTDVYRALNAPSLIESAMPQGLPPGLSEIVIGRAIHNISVAQPRLFEDLATLHEKITSGESGYFIPDAERALALHGDISGAIDLMFPGRSDLKKYSWDSAAAIDAQKFRGSDRQWTVGHNVPQIDADGNRTFRRIVRKFKNESEANAYLATVSSHGSAAELIQALKGENPPVAEKIPRSNLKAMVTKAIRMDGETLYTTDADGWSVANLDRIFATKEEADAAALLLSENDVMSMDAPAQTPISLSLADISIGEMEHLIRSKASFGIGASPITFVPKMLRILNKADFYAPGRPAKDVMTGDQWLKLLKNGWNGSRATDHELKTTGIVELLYAFKDLPISRKEVAMFVFTTYPTTGRRTYASPDFIATALQPGFATPIAQFPYSATRLFGRRLFSVVKAQMDLIDKSIAEAGDADASLVLAQEALKKMHEDSLKAAYERVASLEALIALEERLGIRGLPIMEKLNKLFNDPELASGTEHVPTYVMESYRNNLNNLVEASRATSLAALTGFPISIEPVTFVDDMTVIPGQAVIGPEAFLDPAVAGKTAWQNAAALEINTELGGIFSTEARWGEYTSGLGRYMFDALYTEVKLDPKKVGDYEAYLSEKINSLGEGTEERVRFERMKEAFTRVKHMRALAAKPAQSGGHMATKAGVMQLSHARLTAGHLTATMLPGDTLLDLSAEMKSEGDPVIPTLVVEEFQSDTHQAKQATFGPKKLEGFGRGAQSSFEGVELARKEEALSASIVDVKLVLQNRERLFQEHKNLASTSGNLESIDGAIEQKVALDYLGRLNPASAYAMHLAFKEASSKESPFVDTGRKIAVPKAAIEAGLPDEIPVFEFRLSTKPRTRQSQIDVLLPLVLNSGLRGTLYAGLNAMLTALGEATDLAFASELGETAGSTSSFSRVSSNRHNAFGSGSGYGMLAIAYQALAMSSIPKDIIETAANKAADKKPTSSLALARDSGLNFDDIAVKHADAIIKTVEGFVRDTIMGSTDGIFNVDDPALLSFMRALYNKEAKAALSSYLTANGAPMGRDMSVQAHAFSDEIDKPYGPDNNFESDVKSSISDEVQLPAGQVDEYGNTSRTVPRTSHSPDVYSDTPSGKAFREISNVLVDVTALPNVEKRKDTAQKRTFLNNFASRFPELQQKLSELGDEQIEQAFQEVYAKYTFRGLMRPGMSYYRMTPAQYGAAMFQFANVALGVSKEQFVDTIVEHETTSKRVRGTLGSDKGEKILKDLRTGMTSFLENGKINAAAACWFGQSTFRYNETFTNFNEDFGRYLGQIDSNGDSANGSFAGAAHKFRLPTKFKSKTALGQAMEIAFIPFAIAKFTSTGRGDQHKVMTEYKAIAEKIGLKFEDGSIVEPHYSDMMPHGVEGIYRPLMAQYNVMRAIQNGQRAVTYMDARHHRARWAGQQSKTIVNLSRGVAFEIPDNPSHAAMAYVLKVAKDRKSNGALIDMIHDVGLEGIIARSKDGKFEHNGSTKSLDEHLNDAADEIMAEMPLERSGKDAIKEIITTYFTLSNGYVRPGAMLSSTLEGWKVNDDGTGLPQLAMRVEKALAKPNGIVQVFPYHKGFGYCVNYGSPLWMNKLFFAGASDAEQIRFAHDAFEKFTIIAEPDGTYTVQSPSGKAVFTKIKERFQARELAAQSAKYLGSIPYVGNFLNTFRSIGAYAATGFLQGTFAEGQSGLMSNSGQKEPSLTSLAIPSEEVAAELALTRARSGRGSFELASEKMIYSPLIQGDVKSMSREGGVPRENFVPNLQVIDEGERKSLRYSVAMHALGVRRDSSVAEITAALRHITGNTGPSMIIRPFFPTKAHDIAYAQLIDNGLPMLSMRGLSDEAKLNASVGMFKKTSMRYYRPVNRDRENE